MSAPEDQRRSPARSWPSCAAAEWDRRADRNPAHRPRAPRPRSAAIAGAWSSRFSSAWSQSTLLSAYSHAVIRAARGRAQKNGKRLGPVPTSTMSSAASRGRRTLDGLYGAADDAVVVRVRLAVIVLEVRLRIERRPLVVGIACGRRAWRRLSSLVYGHGRHLARWVPEMSRRRA